MGVMKMYVIDGHCDAISKLMLHPESDFYNENDLDVTLPRLVQGKVKLQSFAIYIPQSKQPAQFDSLLEAIDIFNRKILSHAQMELIQYKEDLGILTEDQKIGALLTLEGADAIQGNWMYLRILFQLGVRAIGITWNYSNWAADGVGEPRRAGLTLKGKQFVKECEKLGILMDVSHLSEQGFWDLVDIAEKPFYASHSNAYSVCPHPRNLTDKQIQAIIDTDGAIGLTFVPYFVSRNQHVYMTDLLRHIEWVCSLGGARHLSFGSDFDGIDQWVDGLQHPGHYHHLKEELLKHYKEIDVVGWLSQNWLRFFNRNLPNRNVTQSF
jgi:membrane dipeptidase